MAFKPFAEWSQSMFSLRPWPHLEAQCSSQISLHAFTHSPLLNSGPGWCYFFCLADSLSAQSPLCLDQSSHFDASSSGPWLLPSPGIPGGSDGKESACSVGDPGPIPGLGRSPGEGNGNPLQFYFLENPMDGGAWQATVHGVTKSQIQLSDFTFISHHGPDPFSHSTVLRTPGSGPFSGLQAPWGETANHS